MKNPHDQAQVFLTTILFMETKLNSKSNLILRSDSQDLKR